MMPIRLTLIAHAETDATRRGVFPFGEGLNPRGREAATRLAGGFSGTVEAITSPAPAARETATAFGFEATIEPALADVDIGTWAGRSVLDIGMQDAEAATAWIEDPSFAGHGGESYAALITRIGSWLAARRDQRGVVVAITHAAVLRAAVVAVLGAEPRAFWRVEAAPLAMLTLSSDGRRWTVRDLRQP